jgi:hypothetical protein
MSRDTHTGINKQALGPKNPGLEAQEPDSVYPPGSDAGGQPPFEYPFARSHRRIESGGWTRQVTVPTSAIDTDVTHGSNQKRSVWRTAFDHYNVCRMAVTESDT